MAGKRSGILKKIKALKELSQRVSCGLTQINTDNIETSEDLVHALYYMLQQLRDKKRLLRKTKNAIKEARVSIKELKVDLDRSYSGDRRTTARYRVSLALKNYSQLLNLEVRLTTSIYKLEMRSRILERKSIKLGLKI